MTPSTLAELEQRVARLEALLEQSAPGTSAPAGAEPPTADDTFWALDGLTARSADDPLGQVMIVGSVTLPNGLRARWQEGAATADLMDDDWERTAESLQALGHPLRLRLLQEVVRGRSTVRELAALDDVGTTGQVYHHVRQLVAAGWLRARSGGRHEVPAEHIVPLLAILIGGRR